VRPASDAQCARAQGARRNPPAASNWCGRGPQSSTFMVPSSLIKAACSRWDRSIRGAGAGGDGAAGAKCGSRGRNGRALTTER
jgi:hypothetical protein